MILIPRFKYLSHLFSWDCWQIITSLNFQNPYQLRLDDFVNESSIQKIVKGVGTSCGALRNGYVAVQDDAPEGWSLFSTLIYFGLGALTPGSNERTNPPTSEEAKELFASL